MKKTVIKLLFWVAAIFFAYMIYQSIDGPVKFKKVKITRFQGAVNSLKDIRNAQEAHKTVNGVFAANFSQLIKFVDQGKYVITQQRDSSYMQYDKNFGIDMQIDVKIIDTLGVQSVKDSIFKNSDRYKTMMNVPLAKNGEKFEMKSATIDKSGNRISVFKAWVKKSVLLSDQPKDLQGRENVQNSVEEVNGDEISVGSLDEISTSGNWPPVYDKKKK